MLPIYYGADASGLLTSLRSFARSAGSVPATGPLRAATIAAGERYLRFATDRMQSLASGGGDWAPLKASTVRARERAGYGGEAPILQETGRLIRSMQPGDAENVLQPMPDGVLAGTAVPYADFVNAARPFIVDPDQRTQGEIGAILAEGLREQAEVG